jgi:uncharacterized repeat protein (TIGR02543 family)
VTVLDSGTLVRTGYNFAGWNTTFDGTGTSYAIGATFSITGNTILYAKWSLITYTVSYNGNTNTGGNPLTDGSSPYLPDSIVTVLGTGTLIKTGYNFTAWNSVYDGTGDSYAIGDTFNITENTVLCAQWSPITYTVAYNGNANTGGDPLTDGSSPYLYGSTVTTLGAGTLVKTGNNFVGWNTSADGTGTNYAIGANFTIFANTILFARWVPLYYTVTYNGNTNTGGTPLTDGSSPYISGSTVTLLGAGTLEKTGYTFDSWNTSADGTGTNYAVGANFTINANTILYAKWV